METLNETPQPADEQKEARPNPAEASEELSDADLAYIAKQAEKAQESVDEFMQRTNLSEMEKTAHLDGKVKRYEESLANMDQGESDELAKLETDFARLAEIQPLIYSPRELSRTQNEIKTRYIRRRELTRQTIGLLNEAQKSLNSEEPVSTTVEQVAKEPITEAETPEEVTPEETPVEEVKPEVNKINITHEEVNEKMRRFKDLAEEMNNFTLRLNRIADGVYSREPWYRPMMRFNDEYVRTLRSKIRNVQTDTDRLRNINSSIEKNHPQTDKRYEELSQELNFRWNSINDTIEEARHFIQREKVRTEDLTRNSLDIDNPISQSGQVLRRMQESVGNRRR